jgi:aconitate hydratase 2/2-methylisocitrate dehydratase
VEFIKAGGSYAIMVKKLQTFAATTLNIDIPQVYAASKEIYRWTRSYRRKDIQ